jgi:recombination protein RecR
MLPEPIQQSIDLFARLPGIGPKTAARLVFYLLRTRESGLSEKLGEALAALMEGTDTCPICFNMMSAGKETCQICADSNRDQRLICVVEEPLDVPALESTSGFQGVYHVLQGALSPVEGITPDDLKIKELVQRVKEGNVKEVILATNPSMEGDATAMYLQGQLAGKDIKVTRLARGLPMGGDLEYADQHTLLRALMGRQEMD